MLSVFTNNPLEHQKLSQQYPYSRNYYQVSTQQPEILLDLIEQITYSSFNHQYPPIVTLIKQLLLNAINSTINLELYRTLIDKIKIKEQKFVTYSQYILTLNRVIAENQVDQSQHQYLQIGSLIDQQSNRIFEASMANDGQSILQLQDLVIPKLELESTLKHHEHSAKTIQSEENIQCSNQNYQPQSPRPYKSTINLGQLCNFFQSAQIKKQKDGDKTDRSQKQSSRQITKFDIKNNGILLKNRNLKSLVIDQFRYDLTRQSFISHSNIKQTQLEAFKYQKRIKNTIMASKLRLKKR